MNKSGPIIIIEDDIDDQDILAEIFKELNYNNKLIFFGDSLQALEYLTDTDIEPFLVLSDINMPKLNGLELREKIHNNEDLRLKSIPYLFFSTSAEQQHVIEAYSRSIQGFFVKPSNYDKLKNTLVKIVEYWQECESPKYIKNAQ
ncbi:response regulator [Dyadobacter sp. CY312]|uniref:response regulator n=1 Tax=Dyadobacter sp. CY312 TaxID=2907303 RepID=UPI001F2F7B79|nr:response regulator [Dyadobacter sp. CY312]MCE7042894.1 response regulator [Dyadobacter sp. CY312]